MKISPLEVHLISQKLIANVSPEYAKTIGLPAGHRSCAFFSVDVDDAAYLALDYATKNANIQVNRAETFYGGNMASWSRYGGAVYAMFSGLTVQDVRSGLSYVNDFIKNQTELYCFNNDPGLAFYAHSVARSGKFFETFCKIKPGSSYAYLVGGPIETNYALDQALKAANTTVARYWSPPSHANSSGAVLTGTESACRAATKAFIQALSECVQAPLAY